MLHSLTLACTHPCTPDGLRVVCDACSVSYGNDEKQQTSVAYMESCNVQFMKAGLRGISILFASGDQVGPPVCATFPALRLEARMTSCRRGACEVRKGGPELARRRVAWHQCCEGGLYGIMLKRRIA